jgi:hypothetical protein
MPATTRGEGMTDSPPPLGLSTSRAHLALEQHTTHPSRPPPGAASNSHFDPPPRTSMRRSATASRTKAAHAVALRAILDTAAYLNAPTSRRKTQEERSRAKNEGLTGPAPSGMTCALGRIRTCNLLIRRSGSHARRVALAWSGRPLRCLSCLGWWWTTSFRTHRDPHRTVAGLASCLGESTPTYALRGARQITL